MKRIFTLILLFTTSLIVAQELKSPNQNIKVTFNQSKDVVSFSVTSNNKGVIQKGEIDLMFNNTSLLKGRKMKVSKQNHFDNKVLPVVPFKEAIIDDVYNQVILSFGRTKVEFRAYDDGIAYRYITNEKNEVEVNEKFDITFFKETEMWASLLKGYSSSFEIPYKKINVDSISVGINTYMPLLLQNKEENKILMTESDIEDYPHMFFTKGKNHQLRSTFPNYPLDVERIGDRQSKVIKTADYVALTKGKRSFPWRIMIITEDDADLVASNLAFTLASKNVLEDTEWIKPGRVSWEWWNASNLYGVDFKAGFNTESYKYYIDFAAEYGLEYIILDEGWSFSTKDLSKPNTELDLFELIRYGNEKKVGIILWATWKTLDEQLFVLDNFQKWGVKGVKVDFMDRADQLMVDFYDKIARLCAERELLVDFHGAYKPVGLHRKYPNVVSYEGVHGLENDKWSNTVTPEHDVTIPFIRMVCGPMDYTPGAMRNYHQEEFVPNWTRPGSQGTRAHQVALFVIYESGIQMLADSPSNYKKEHETTSFLAQIPVTWEDTKVISAKVGEYLIMARKNGDQWFIGGLTNNEEREMTIDLSFLGEGNYEVNIFQDGINAAHFAEDYQILSKDVKSNSQLTIKMVKGGGYAAIINKK
ncbi:glycoside hydrolase family 97 protein [Flammeovirga sp. MY04]|uniref:glycoside hydrolase family 97 protein n=1 Tax=Flammeovirga sp. MY04 TaxID=1191459 RepID=UPI0008061CF0|nr:glycoside hydrolase family 97 protein [Flammeovirga sp. MY04]ANQ52698.1 glycoside hydrolase family 97 protein [Flammeovirga sp. MY04]